MKQTEDLLFAWLSLSNTICNERLVSDMPFNEALICNLLDRNGGDGMYAAQLCAQTGMLKSQMNRTLNSMEQKNLIRRERSQTDRRQVRVFLTQNSLYENQHRKSIELVKKIIEQYGKERAAALTHELYAIAGIAREVLS